MLTDFLPGIVRILRADGSTSGTGFIVSADGLIVTCSHVLQGKEAQKYREPRPERVTVVFHATGQSAEANVLAEFWRGCAAEDVAALRARGALPPEAQPLPLARSAGSARHPFRSFGFPDLSPDEGVLGAGEILGGVTLRAVKVLQLRSPEVTPGFSGAPVWDDALKAVVGMVCDIATPDKFGKLGETAFAVQSEALLAICPELKASVPGILHNVPELPRHYLPRPADLAPLKAALLAPEGGAHVGLTGKALKAGVQGMGGVGKSVLVAALAHDEEIGRVFPDGIIWLTLGQQPNLPERQAQLAEALGEPGHAFADMQRGRAALEKLLAPAACLLVLDDVWELEHAEAFNVLGPAGRMLLTTRNAEVVRALGASLHSLDVLDEPQALALLANWAGTTPAELPPVARDVAQECGYLPLALAMGGALVRRNPESWERALRRLCDADLEKIRREFPDYPYPNLLRAIQVSVEALPEDVRQCYLELAVSPEDTPIPPATLRVYWNMDADDVAEICEMLENRSLARRDADGRLTLHDLQYDFVRAQMRADLPGLHNRLLNSYRTTDWADLPQAEPYLWDWLAYHLLAAGRGPELAQTVQDLRYLAAKTQARNSLAAEADLKAAETFAPDDAVLRFLRQQFGNLTHLLKQCKTPNDIGTSLYVRLSQYPQLADACCRLEPHIFRPYIKARLPFPDTPHPALIRTLTGHTDLVKACAYSPDGRWIVSASWDNKLKVWDAETGAEHLTLTGHTAEVTGCAYSPDGRRIVSASYDETLKVWEAETGTERLTLTGHNAPVFACAYSPDGRRIVSASLDQTLKVWEAETGTERLTLTGHTDLVLACAYSPDGQRIVSASGDHMLKVWDAGTGTERLTLVGHTGSVHACAYSPDGRRIVSASEDETLKVWDAETGGECLTLSGHTGEVNACVYSPDGRRIVSASSDHMLRVWDAKTGAERLTLAGHAAWVIACAYSPDGRRIISASGDRFGTDCTLKMWDAETGAEHSRAGHSDRVNACAYSADGRLLVSASRDCTLKVWDAETGAERLTLIGHTDFVNGCAYSPDGRWIVSASGDHTLKVWDAGTGTECLTLAGHTDSVRACAYSPDGQRIVSASADNTLKVWDAETGAERLTLSGNAVEVYACVYSPDGRRIVSAPGGTLTAWDPETGAERLTLTRPIGRVGAFAYSADGRWIVSASSENTLEVRIAETGAACLTLSGHTDYVEACAVSPDGQRIVSASHDGTLKVWDAETGACLATFYANGQLAGCAIAPNGKDMVAVGEAGIYWLRWVE